MPTTLERFGVTREAFAATEPTLYCEHDVSDLLRTHARDDALEGLLAVFKDRALPFAAEAIRCHADLTGRARDRGCGSPTPDGDFAAIAASRGFDGGDANRSAVPGGRAARD